MPNGGPRYGISTWTGACWVETSTRRKPYGGAVRLSTSDRRPLSFHMPLLSRGRARVRRVDGQTQFVAEQAIPRPLPGKLRAACQNDRHALSAAVHQRRSAGLKARDPAGNRAAGKQARQRFVAACLTVRQVLYGERVRQRTRRVQLDAVGEHVQPYTAPMHRVVAVSYGVDYRFEHGGHVVLRLIHAAERLSGAHLLVANDELTCGRNLRVERSRDVGGVELVPSRLQGLRDRPAAVGHRLDVGVGQPSLRLPSAE